MNTGKESDIHSNSLRSERRACDPNLSLNNTIRKISENHGVLRMPGAVGNYYSHLLPMIGVPPKNVATRSPPITSILSTSNKDKAVNSTKGCDNERSSSKDREKVKKKRKSESKCTKCSSKKSEKSREHIRINDEKVSRKSSGEKSVRAKRSSSLKRKTIKPTCDKNEETVIDTELLNSRKSRRHSSKPSSKTSSKPSSKPSSKQSCNKRETSDTQVQEEKKKKEKRSKSGRKSRSRSVSKSGQLGESMSKSITKATSSDSLACAKKNAHKRKNVCSENRRKKSTNTAAEDRKSGSTKTVRISKQTHRHKYGRTESGAETMLEDENSHFGIQKKFVEDALEEKETIPITIEFKDSLPKTSKSYQEPMRQDSYVSEVLKRPVNRNEFEGMKFASAVKFTDKPDESSSCNSLGEIEDLTCPIVSSATNCATKMSKTNSAKVTPKLSKESDTNHNPVKGLKSNTVNRAKKHSPDTSANQSLGNIFRSYISLCGKSDNDEKENERREGSQVTSIHRMQSSSSKGGMRRPQSQKQNHRIQRLHTSSKHCRKDKKPEKGYKMSVTVLEPDPKLYKDMTTEFDPSVQCLMTENSSARNGTISFEHCITPKQPKKSKRNYPQDRKTLMKALNLNTVVSGTSVENEKTTLDMIKPRFIRKKSNAGSVSTCSSLDKTSDSKSSYDAPFEACNRLFGINKLDFTDLQMGTPISSSAQSLQSDFQARRYYEPPRLVSDSNQADTSASERYSKSPDSEDNNNSGIDTQDNIDAWFLPSNNLSYSRIKQHQSNSLFCSPRILDDVWEESIKKKMKKEKYQGSLERKEKDQRPAEDGSDITPSYGSVSGKDPQAIYEECNPSATRSSSGGWNASNNETVEQKFDDFKKRFTPQEAKPKKCEPLIMAQNDQKQLFSRLAFSSISISSNPPSAMESPYDPKESDNIMEIASGTRLLRSCNIPKDPKDALNFLYSNNSLEEPTCKNKSIASEHTLKKSTKSSTSQKMGFDSKSLGSGDRKDGCVMGPPGSGPDSSDVDEGSFTSIEEPISGENEYKGDSDNVGETELKEKGLLDDCSHSNSMAPSGSVNVDNFTSVTSLSCDYYDRNRDVEGEEESTVGILFKPRSNERPISSDDVKSEHCEGKAGRTDLLSDDINSSWDALQKYSETYSRTKEKDWNDNNKSLNNEPLFCRQHIEQSPRQSYYAEQESREFVPQGQGSLQREDSLTPPVSHKSCSKQGSKKKTRFDLSDRSHEERKEDDFNPVSLNETVDSSDKKRFNWAPPEKLGINFNALLFTDGSEKNCEGKAGSKHGSHRDSSSQYGSSQSSLTPRAVPRNGGARQPSCCVKVKKHRKQSSSRKSHPPTSDEASSQVDFSKSDMLERMYSPKDFRFKRISAGTVGFSNMEVNIRGKKVSR